MVDQPTNTSGPLALYTVDLTKRHRQSILSNRATFAVRNISFCLGRGETIALLGRNGAGKTTFLKLLLGLVQPTSGVVHICRPSPPFRRCPDFIGYAPENFYLRTNDSVATVLTTVATLKGLPREDRRGEVLERARQVGITPVLDIPVGQLSKGLLRRLAIAQSLIGAPGLLLLDEPMDGLDPEARMLVRELINSLKEQGSSILLCTHLLSEVEALADKIAIMNEGRLAVAGDLQELLARQESFIVCASGPISRKGCIFFRSKEAWLCRVHGRESLDALVRAAKAETKIIESITKMQSTLESLFLEFAGGGNSDGQE
jgi:ABC-2 type transport system ATP-binding protein